MGTEPYKYKCDETACNAVVDDNKWHRHCETKHTYKTCTHMNIKPETVEFRIAKGLWQPYSKGAVPVLTTGTITGPSFTTDFCLSNEYTERNRNAVFVMTDAINI